MGVRRWIKGLLVATGLVVAGVYLLLTLTPSTQMWARYPTDSSLNHDNALAVTWLGTSTLLISDGITSLMTDGYFSRVSRWQTVSSDLSPNAHRIDAALATLDTDHLAAIMVLHSHFDHVMDAPWIAAKTGAELVGSTSTANVGRGAGLPESQIRVPVEGSPIRYGDFEVIFLTSAHVPQNPLIDRMTGMNEEIDQPLTPPAPVQAWKEGESYAVLIRHPRGTILVQGSAGFVEGQLEGYQADIAFVSSVGLFRQPANYTERYVHNTVAATGAKQVIPIHWDDFFVELTPHTPPLPWLLEDLNASWALLDAAVRPLDASLYLLEPMDTLYFRRQNASGNGVDGQVQQ